MAKRRKYNLSHIRQNYAYTTEEIAELFDIGIATVRIWVKEGLQLVPKARPHLVHSSSLHTFLSKRQAKHKKPCKPNEIYCCGCRKSHPPAMGSLYEEKLPNNTYRLTAKCEQKGNKMCRVLKAADWVDKHPLAKFKKDAPKQHNGAHKMPRKPEFQEGEQPCLDLTL